MIPAIPPHRFTRGLIASLCLISFAAGMTRAQSETKEERALALASQRAAHATAKELAQRGDFAAAAQALDAFSTAPAGSSERLFETAQSLTLLASDLSRAGNGAGAQSAAIAALQLLADAARGTRDVGLKAAIQGQAGFLYERYLGDIGSAKAAYRAAATLEPGNAAVREKADKLERADAGARNRAAQNR